MHWVNFLHMYQPPTQREEIIRQVTLECYRPLVRILRKHKSARMTLNINACLTEHLIRYGFSDVIDGLGQLAQEGRVELTGSAKYHPILPLIPESEMERQITLNHESNAHYFKGVYRPKGFFSPEMCYSQQTAAVIKKMGFEWLIVDEIAFNGKLNHCQRDCLYILDSLAPLNIFFKERKVSTAIAFGRCKDLSEFMRLNMDILSQEGYLLTGTDGEVYGHHLPGQERLLEEIFNQQEIITYTISQLNSAYFKRNYVEPIPSSWSTGEDDIIKGVPYPQWSDPANEIHKWQWKLMEIAMHAVHRMKLSHGDAPAWGKARHALDEGLHSCQWWWASCRPWWGVDMVQRGVDTLMESVLHLKSLGLDHAVIEEAGKIKGNIEHVLYEWDTTGKALKMQREYLQSHQEITSLLRFGK